MKVIPYFREVYKQNFVDINLIPTTMVKVGNTEYPTAPLAINKNIDLVAISTTAALLEGGFIDVTDEIIGDVYLQAIYANHHSEILKIPVVRNEYSCFMKKDGILVLEYGNINGIWLNGRLNPESSECIVHQSRDSNPSYQILGYELDLERGNYER